MGRLAAMQIDTNTENNMKTIEDLNGLINIEASKIEALIKERNAGRGGATREEWANRQREIKKQIGKSQDEISRLRKFILFVERVDEEGVVLMLDKLYKEVQAITDGAEATCPAECPRKICIRQYKNNAGVPLKRKQIKELEFLLKR